MATARVAVRRPILEWAQRRSGHGEEAMRKRFREWDRWLTEDVHPTVNQAQDLAAYTHVPFGLLLLPEPPATSLPIPDFRSGPGAATEPSQGLLETVYLMQQRQAWFEDYLAALEADPLAFPGSGAGDDPSEVAARITAALDYGLAHRAAFRTADDARKHLVRAFENVGGLVAVSSMVGNNTHRMLDRDEFRGFTLHSAVAPFVFVNANDTKRGQIFSLLHEFAHVWRGDTGVSYGGDPLIGDRTATERWCDQVAAEIAVPRDDLIKRAEPGRNLTDELERLSDFYRCSTLVVLIRLRDTGMVPIDGFTEAYAAELGRLMALIGERAASGGGDFYNNQPFRIGEKLSRALIRDTHRGRTAMTEALRLMALGSTSVFDKYASRLGEL